MDLKTQPASKVTELGFSPSQGVHWGDYIQYRPIYRPSFFERIYRYHSRKPCVFWRTAHDVGAGHGIVSSTLADKFHHVVVSDPNKGYGEIARQLLVEKSGLPESKFRFLQEGAEESSVESETVDLIAACECMQWTDTEAAVKEFARQLKPGGTLAMTYYTRPLIINNEPAQAIWKSLFDAYSTRASGDLLDRAFQVLNSGFDSIALPAQHWETVERVYINARQGISSFRLDGRAREDRVTEGEERIWIYDDPDWAEEQGVEWLKKYLGTWVPPLPEAEVQGLWDELSRITDGAKVKLETPIVMVFATRKAEEE
ncbi:S-adenosyl-L-methionine-dependent methyltransferase [Xylaria grammica]|nr:S-adenosyl-L-methionine-dependent methyltransferase [Xylaria grammica]